MDCRHRILTPARLLTIGVVMGWLSGCGSSTEPPQTTSQPVEQAASVEPLPAPALPVQVSPDELMERVAQLTAAEFDREPLDLTPEVAQAVAFANKSRSREIVQLSMEVISQVHDDPAQRQLFDNAVHYLSDAQVELALTGDKSAERELIENAASLIELDPKSLAAIEANAKVVELARLQAEQAGTDELARAYANQARLFATNFNHEPNRAAVTLLDAARWCDRRGYVDTAIACYTELVTTFESTLFASQAEGPLRRLSMLGEPLLEFTGPTIDGGMVTRSQYNGQPMVVVFWDSRDPDLHGTFARLDEACRERTKVDIALIGVCLDDSASTARSTIAALPQRPQIFSSNSGEQGRSNPLAQYYGVLDTPTIWMIASDGTVMSLDAVPEDVASLR